MVVSMKVAEVFHPAEFIEEELQERGWTVRDLVFRMRRYESERDWAVNCLAVEMYLSVRDKNILLTPEMAHEFADALGMSGEFFSNLDAQWRQGV